MKTEISSHIHTVGEMKSAIKVARKVYVWVNWGADGDYVEVAKKAFLRAINADTPNDGAHGGCPDGTQLQARFDDDGCIYVN